MEKIEFGIVHGGTFRKEPWGTSLSDVLERDDLHRALLFWDRMSIPWASNPMRPIIRGPVNELQYLEAAGILDAPLYDVSDLPDDKPIVPLSHAGIVVMHDFF